MGWSELNRKSKVKLENNGKGFIDITAKSTNINTAIERAVEELYYNYDGNTLITMEINRVLIILDRFDNPKSASWDILGRRYKAQSDIFLTKAITLGRIDLEQWNDYTTFCSQMQSLVKCWVELTQKDKEISTSYHW